MTASSENMKGSKQSKLPEINSISAKQWRSGDATHANKMV